MLGQPFLNIESPEGKLNVPASHNCIATYHWNVWCGPQTQKTICAAFISWYDSVAGKGVSSLQSVTSIIRSTARHTSRIETSLILGHPKAYHHLFYWNKKSMCHKLGVNPLIHKTNFDDSMIWSITTSSVI